MLNNFALRIENVFKSFDEKNVLKDISFEVKKGEFIVLVGPSGCGKSTMLRIIAGLASLDKGRVIINDKDVSDFAPKDRDIAMVFQDYALYPHKNVFENIAFGLKMRNIDAAEINARVDKAAKKLDLLDLLKRKPAQLSGGQRQRVAIGRAIVRNPKVFLFDEPLSNLDAKLRSSMRLTIAKLQKELNATTVYVTHDQIEAMTLADKIIVLNEGIIQQMGHPLDLYFGPRNIFVATFIGSPEMNLIDGTLKGGPDDTLIFVTQKGVEILIPKHFYPKLSIDAKPGTEVVLGFRPDNLKYISEDDDVSTRKDVLDASVLVSEALGSINYVLCDIGGHEILVALQGNKHPKFNDKLKLSWQSKHLYMFDKKTTVTMVVS